MQGSTNPPKLSVKTVLLPIIGLVAFFLYLLLFNVDIPQILATAQRANPLLFTAAVLVSLVEVFFYAASWRAILNFLSVKISVVRSYLYVWYGIFMDIVIPAESISGELCRVYLVNREQDGTSGKAVASVVTQRLLGMSMNVIFLVAGIGLLFSEARVDPLIFNTILFFAAAITALIAVIILVSAKETWSLKAIHAAIRVGEFITRGKWKRLNQLKEEAVRDAKIFHDSMKAFIHRPKTLILPSLLVGLNWVCSLVVPYLVFLSLGFQVPLSALFITSAIVVAVKSIPIGIPFEVGLPEITMTTLFTSLLGIQYAGICATATILSRIITLWLRFAIGFAAQQWVELKPVCFPQTCPPAEKP
ncbi:MAG: lysylphosphatidylglycerol synthase transmembrane domain-containing protein [Candidatus Bathyarchaeia archaeon]